MRQATPRVIISPGAVNAATDSQAPNLSGDEAAGQQEEVAGQRGEGAGQQESERRVVEAVPAARAAWNSAAAAWTGNMAASMSASMAPAQRMARWLGVLGPNEAHSPRSAVTQHDVSPKSAVNGEHSTVPGWVSSLKLPAAPQLCSGAMRFAAVSHAPAALVCVGAPGGDAMLPMTVAPGAHAPLLSMQSVLSSLRLLVTQQVPAASRLAGGAGLHNLMRPSLMSEPPPPLAAFAALRPPPMLVQPPYVRMLRGEEDAATAGAAVADMPLDLGAGGPSSAAFSNASYRKAELGRATWTLLHTLAAQLPDRPTRQQQRDAKGLVDILTRCYPCGDCAKHFSDIVRRDPPVVSSGHEFQAWLCRVHNVVNRRIGKPAFNCDVVAARWAPLDCSDEGGTGCDLLVGRTRR
uniref:Sulfhydryl oxidase n=1 Tax=Chlamydomonas euryale TaxID=1486919 RepID=A0A7R9VKP3_9CHLO|mmetsp:Transcript_36749/g.108360  ORF Transcript_36749/g.108360 Transcript_36749/m.108360 type:complete len:407 (+) Transcript_36749:321-1541(+)